MVYDLEQIVLKLIEKENERISVTGLKTVEV